jgi:hypothetical protein
MVAKDGRQRAKEDEEVQPVVSQDLVQMPTAGNLGLENPVQAFRGHVPDGGVLKDHRAVSDTGNGGHGRSYFVDQILDRVVIGDVAEALC